MKTKVDTSTLKNSAVKCLCKELKGLLKKSSKDKKRENILDIGNVVIFGESSSIKAEFINALSMPNDKIEKNGYFTSVINKPHGTSRNVKETNNYIHIQYEINNVSEETRQEQPATYRTTFANTDCFVFVLTQNIQDTYSDAIELRKHAKVPIIFLASSSSNENRTELLNNISTDDSSVILHLTMDSTSKDQVLTEMYKFNLLLQCEDLTPDELAFL